MNLFQKCCIGITAFVLGTLAAQIAPAKTARGTFFTRLEKVQQGADSGLPMNPLQSAVFFNLRSQKVFLMFRLPATPPNPDVQDPTSDRAFQTLEVEFDLKPTETGSCGEIRYLATNDKIPANLLVEDFSGSNCSNQPNASPIRVEYQGQRSDFPADSQRAIYRGRNFIYL